MKTNLKNLGTNVLVDLLVREVDKYGKMINLGYGVFDYKELELEIQALQFEILSRKRQSGMFL